MFIIVVNKYKPRFVRRLRQLLYHVLANGGKQCASDQRLVSEWAVFSNCNEIGWIFCDDGWKFTMAELVENMLCNEDHYRSAVLRASFMDEVEFIKSMKYRTKNTERKSTDGDIRDVVKRNFGGDDRSTDEDVWDVKRDDSPVVLNYKYFMFCVGSYPLLNVKDFKDDE